MELSYDHKQFGDLQNRLVDAIAAAIHSNLVEAGITDPKTLSAATYNITSDVAAIVDSCSTEQDFFPFLTFRAEKSGDVFVHGKGSWMHECLDEDAIDSLCGLSAES